MVPQNILASNPTGSGSQFYRLLGLIGFDRFWGHPVVYKSHSILPNKPETGSEGKLIDFIGYWVYQFNRIWGTQLSIKAILFHPISLKPEVRENELIS